MISTHQYKGSVDLQQEEPSLPLKFELEHGDGVVSGPKFCLPESKIGGDHFIVVDACHVELGQTKFLIGSSSEKGENSSNLGRQRAEPHF